MAESKKATTAEKLVKIKLRRNPDPRAAQEEFYSLNFKNYIIKRGVEVEVPEAIAKMIEENEEAEEYAANYAAEHKMRVPNV